MGVNSCGGRVTHTMADGTELNEVSGYLARHPEVEIPPVALRILGEILTGKHRNSETRT